MASTELIQSALFVAFISISLLALVTWTLYPRKKSVYDAELDQMVNGFQLELPEAIEEYNEIKKKYPNDRQKLAAALFKRAVADIPLIRRMQQEGHGIPRLKSNDILRESSFINYKYAEDAFHKEVEEVQAEAERLRPDDNWGQKIFQQAVDFIIQLQSNELTQKQQEDMQQHQHEQQQRDLEQKNRREIEQKNIRQRVVT